MTTREPSTRRAANRSPRSVVWRLLAALVALTLSILGMATPAHAAAAADIAKELDATQGRGFTSPDTFEVGALVRYRITVSCSSLDTACVTGTVTDVLDPNLQFVQVIAPVAKNNDGQTLPITTTTSGQTVTTTVGSSAAPLQGGNSLELVLVARVKSTPASGTIPNQASIAVPGAPTVNSEIVTIKVPPTQPRYQISKSGSDNVAPGEPATYYLRLGGSQFSNVDIVLPMTIVDTYPAGATVVSTDGGVVDTANHTITWTVTSLPYQIASNPGGSCDYTGWCTVWGVTVVLKYNSPTFSGGQTVTNSVVTDPTYTSGDLPPLTSSKDTGIVASAPSANVSKYGPTEASPGNTVEWFVTSTNNGNSTLANYAVTDTLPAGVTNVSIFSTSYDQPLYPPSLGPVTFEALVGGTWQQIGTYSTTGDWSNGESMALPSGATAWRMVVASLPADAVMNMKVKADIPATATTGDTFKNCAAVSSTTAGTSLGQDSCVTTTITTPFVGFQPYKAHHFNDSTQTSVIPGETFLWGIGVIPSGPNPVTSLDFADVLPPQFEYVTTRCLAAYGSGYGIQTSLEQVIAGYTWQGPGCDKAGVPQASTVTVNPDGSTSLAWQDVPIDSTGQPSILFDGGSLWWVVFEVRVKPGTAVANYTNQMAVGTGGTDLQTRCAVTGASWAWMRSGWSASWYDAVDPLNPDSADWDKDGNTTETLCRQNDAVQVRLAAAADTTKWDKGPLPNALQSTGQPDPTCPDWGGFTRYPCVAQTNPGGAFAYRFNIQNTGNMTLTNYVGYDILPYLGDTGVGQLLSTQSRATEWVPVLTGPLTVESQPATAGTQILYNLTTNPCRPELATGASDATWQASCDNTWYTAAQISDWSTVKSFKVVAFQNGAVWDAAQQIILQAPMLAPTTAPDSIKSPLDLSIAWNSIAHREFKINSDGTTARLLAAEPLKVGIIVPFAGVSVGDYVWMDSNRDGVQSPGELPIKDVKVELLDASGAVVQTTTTDASGYYSFQYLDKSAQYTIRFTAPTGLLFTKTNAGGVTSNDPVADNGSTALDGTTGGDSDAVVSTDGLTGSVTFTSPATGTNKVSDPVAGTVADNPGLDAGFVPASIPVSIGDFVWFDANRDGQQSAGEPVVPGVTVNLYDSAGTKVGSTTTDSTGYYWFTDLVADAKYTVEFVKPAGTALTTQNSGADATDSDADLVTGKVSVTAPVSGSNVGAAGKADDPTVDAGLVKLNLSLAKALTASGPFYAGSTVTFSLTPHNDGPVDALAGWSVTDILPAGLTLVSMTGTGYTCTGATCVGDSALAAGKDGAVITVTATVDAAFVGSLHNVAYVAPATGETAETNPLVVPTTGTDTSGTTTDNDAQADLLVDSLVSIGDFVWFDTNRDGQQSAGEPFVPGVTVNLLDGAGTVVKTATTDAAGYYVFADLVPGTAYTVEFVKPAGTSFTTATTGASATDSNADPATGKVSVTAPASGVNGTDPGMADDPTIDAGLVKYNLTLVKAYTTVGPVYEGSTVTFTLTPGNDGPVDALAGWSVTDVLPSGLTLVSMAGTGYTCTGATCVAAGPLAAGTFGNVITVTATIDANFTGSAKNVAYVSPSSKDAVETNPLVVPTTTTDTSSTPTDNDAQAPISVSSLVSVGDYAWVDVNRDGLQTPLEPVLAGVVVTLTDAGGATRSTTTDASGYYWFDDLTPGAAYTITFTAPAGYAFTTQTVAGGDPAKDSNADPVTGAWSFTAPAAGVNQVGALVTDDPTIDAGFVKLNLSLTKALVTAGPFYAGGSVEFTLTPHNDGPVDALAGWSVTDILPSGLTLTGMSGAGYACDLALAKCSADAVLAAGADGAVITVTATIDARFVGGLHNVAYVAPAAGETVETNPLVVPSTDTDTDSTDTDNDAQAPLVVDSLVSVGDYVWVDVNRDGLQDGGEPVMAGVTVNLLDSTGTVIRTTTTGSDGYYWFDNLVPGTPYTVQFVKPAGMAFTTANSGDDTVDSDADVVTGTVDFVAPASGSNDTAPGLTDNPTLDAGVIQLNLSLVKSLTATGPFYAGSTVTFDLTPHNDGPVDALAGWSVTDILPSGLTLVSMSGSGYDCQVLTATCTAAGILGAGADGATITVTATVDAAFVGTLHNVAYVSPAAGETAETNPLVVPDTTTDTAATGTDNDAQAPLVVDSLVSIGDYVWVDTNRDGLQDSGEAALAGVTVTLYAADGATVLATAVTDANGKYSFVDLTPGQHYVVEFSAPGYAFTTANSGNDAADSDADVVTGRVDVTAPASGVNGATNPDDPTIDAGVIQLNLVLAKSLTATGPFYAGSTVTFALTPHNDGPVDALTGWSVTDILPSGLTLVSMTGSGYTCTGATCVADGGLPAGTDGPVITVTATIDHAFVGTLHNVAYVSPSAQETTETNPLVVPSTDTNTDTTPTDNDAQAPLEVLSLVSVGDFVWLDVNRDGIQDSTEPVIAGVTVTLTDATGAVVATTTTDANGFYSFVDLVPGATYTITFTRPAGYTFTSQTSGTNTAVDSNADLATGAWTFTAPASGKNSATEPDDPTIDAGVVSYQLTVTKKLNGTGVRHAGDTVTYTIVVHNDGPADALNWTVTDALPDQLTLVSMTGSGYDCTGTTCTATGHLPAGADAAPITVTATIKAGVTKSFSNVAVVKPEPRIPDVPDNDAPTPVEPVNPLPHTGSDLTPLTGAGLALLLLGALSVALTRRQKRREAR